MKTDVFQQITDAIAAQLAQGVRPWSQPWREGADSLAAVQMPHNMRGSAYRGANAFWLDLIGRANGYDRPIWLTFNQARDAGGSVRKGEKGTAVFFWKFEKRADPVTAELRNVAWARAYSVFNLSQVDGVDVKPAVTRPLVERVAAADAMADATGAVIAWSGARAFYSPAFDSVQMPARESFKSADGLYGTLFHELGHWTGHESRLNRTFGRRFKDDAYSFEELVAELTAAFVCGSQGFAAPAREDHASYISGFLRVLKNDPRAFMSAASAAQKAADLIIKPAAAETESEPADIAEAA